MQRKTFSITETHDEWLKAQVTSGQYRSESEVVSDLIRDRQNRDAGVEALRLALLEDEKCDPGPPTRENVKAALQKRSRKTRSSRTK